MGMIEMTAGFLAYFVVLHDYGFKINGIMKITNEYGIDPASGDIYNRFDQYKGNSNAFIYENSNYLGISGLELNKVNELRRQMDYIAEKDNDIDMRVMYYHLNEGETWAECAVKGYTQTGKAQSCYTLDAVRHAQSAYLANVILTQVANGFAYRTITTSLFNHILDNWDLNIAYFLENAIVCLLIYVPGLNTAFGFRSIIFYHWVPCMGVFITIFLYSEFTKYLIRNVNEPDGSLGYFAKYYRY